MRSSQIILEIRFFLDHVLRFNIKTVFPRYVDSFVKDKTVARQSYL